MNIINHWDHIWLKSTYSDPKIRHIKSEKKVKILLSILDVSSDSHILDLGCGGGYVAKLLYEEKKCKITGIDFSQEAILLARKNCEELPITFLNSPAEVLPVNNKSIDYVVCFGCLEHVSNISDVLNEIIRVLKSNGKIFIISSNKLSLMHFEHKIKEFFHCWKYGYQKDWDALAFSQYVAKYKFQKIHESTFIDTSDHKILSFFDKIISFFVKKWGRYFIYVGRISNEDCA